MAVEVLNGKKPGDIPVKTDKHRSNNFQKMTLSDSRPFSVSSHS